MAGFLPRFSTAFTSFLNPARPVGPKPLTVLPIPRQPRAFPFFHAACLYRYMSSAPQDSVSTTLTETSISSWLFPLYSWTLPSTLHCDQQPPSRRILSWSPRGIIGLLIDHAHFSLPSSFHLFLLLDISHPPNPQNSIITDPSLISGMCSGKLLQLDFFSSIFQQLWHHLSPPPGILIFQCPSATLTHSFFFSSPLIIADKIPTPDTFSRPLFSFFSHKGFIFCPPPPASEQWRDD